MRSGSRQTRRRNSTLISVFLGITVLLIATGLLSGRDLSQWAAATLQYGVQQGDSSIVLQKLEATTPRTLEVYAQLSNQSLVSLQQKSVESSVLAASSGTTCTSGTNQKGGVNGDWIPGDERYFAKVPNYKNAINGCLLPKAGNTTLVMQVEERKEEFGIHLSSGSNTSREEKPDPNDPKSWYIVGLCDAAETGQQHGVASVNLSAVPLPRFITQGMQKSLREITEGLAAEINKTFIDSLKPAQYENFCSYMQKQGDYYWNSRTAETFKNESSANSKGNNFFSGVLAACASRLPGDDQKNAQELAKEWLDVENNLDTTTYRISAKNNVKDAEISQDIRDALIAKGLGALRAYNMNQADNYMLVWQSKNSPFQVKNLAVAVATEIIYDRLYAIPQKDSKTLVEQQNFDPASDSTVITTKQYIQNETDRETILSAIVGGMYAVPEKALKGGNNYSMLYFDPVDPNPKKTLCDPNAKGEANRCLAVALVSKCAGIFAEEGFTKVSADIHFPYVNLSTIDTQRWAAKSDRDDPRTYNNAGGEALLGKSSAPGYISKATIEQIVLAGNNQFAGREMTTPRCKALIEPIVSSQIASKTGVVSEEEFEALAKQIIAQKGYKSQAFLALPVEVTGKAYMPYVHILLGQTAAAGGIKDVIPAVYELKLDDLVNGLEAQMPGATNATNFRELLQAALKREGVEYINDGKIDCQMGLTLTGSVALRMWPCEDDGDLLAKCQ